MPDQPTLPKVYLSIDEVSRLLNVEKGTLYNWSYRNYGPTRVKFGNHLRYPSDELFAWIEAQTVREDEVK